MKANRFAARCGLFLVASMFCGPSFADHNTAPVSDVDGGFGFGSGSFSGFYTHQSGLLPDHPWYTFDALAGEIIDIELETSFDQGATQGSYLWLYEVPDGVVEVGDEVGSGLNLVAESSNTDTIPGPFVDQEILGFVAPSSNQYIIQVDSWLGASGDYTLSLSRIPEPTSVALLGAAGVLLATRRHRV